MGDHTISREDWFTSIKQLLLCPLGETHSALDLDPPSYLPVSTLLRGMCEARLGEGRAVGGE